MDSKSLQEHARRVALEMPFTEHCWPFGPEYDVFKVGGKIFMLMATAHGRAHVSLKSDPEKSLLNQQIYRADRTTTQFMQFREHVFHRLLGFGVQLFTDANLADSRMRQGVTNAPVYIAVPDIAGMLFWLGDGAIEIRQHGLAEILLQMQVEGIQQIVFGSKVAKQCPFSDARITGN